MGAFAQDIFTPVGVVVTLSARVDRWKNPRWPQSETTARRPAHREQPAVHSGEKRHGGQPRAVRPRTTSPTG
jgi:hypothetical protein